MRQTHRWLSSIFTLTVAANFVALATGKGAQPPDWVTYSPLLPLVVLMLTDLCLFFQPYLRKARQASRAG
ncbi:MAG: hypothetical protein H7Z15_09735 [Rhizobacter sp.]|nr:hypothetical protein [Rhizobacter sp.]